MPYILSLVTFLPLVGAGLLLLAGMMNKGGQDAAAPAAEMSEPVIRADRN